MAEAGLGSNNDEMALKDRRLNAGTALSKPLIDSLHNVKSTVQCCT
jgi:hypothetical protein